MTHLTFTLDANDGWPPVAREGFECRKRDDGVYEVLAPPLFVPNLSVGDVISVEVDEEGYVRGWLHVAKSANSTVWLMELEAETVTPLLECLKSLRCEIVSFTEFHYYSVNIPADCSEDALDCCLGLVDDTQVAKAFPSFRHGKVRS